MTDPINNPSAYGSVPNIPPTSTNTNTSTSTSTPNLPNYDALASAASMISQNQMAGQLNPQDLANAQQWSAERGVGTGTGFGSPNGMAAYQQFLGLSAQKLEQQGLTNYESLLAGAPRTTDTSGTQTTDNNVLRAEYAAAPDPMAAAMANLAAQRSGLGAGGAAGGGARGATLPGASSTAPNPYSGGGVTPSWQQAGYGSGQEYNDAIDSSIFGWDLTGGGYSGGIDQTVYNPGTDQSQYNYGIPDYYGTGFDTSGGGGYDPYAGTYWDTGGGDYYDAG